MKIENTITETIFFGHVLIQTLLINVYDYK